MFRERVWPHLRAALVAAHLMAIGIAAIPAPEGGMDRGAWRDPTVQAEFSRWAHWFGTSPSRFEDRLFALATAYMDARSHVMHPLSPYLDWTGAQQPWRLFVAPHRFPGRYQVQLHLRGAAPDRWNTLFEERSPTSRWHGAFFEHERIRTAIFRYEWPAFGNDARLFCRYVARWADREFPDADGLRCRFYKAPSPSADEVLARRIPDGTWEPGVLIARRGQEPWP